MGYGIMEESEDLKDTDDNANCDILGIDIDDVEEIKIIEVSELSKLPNIEQMFLNELYNYPLLSSDEQEKLCWLKDSDPEAEEKLFKHNLRLVVSVAKYYQNRGLDFMELIQEGCIGLLKGIKRFDPSKGFKLTTYAMWWIKRSITKAIQNTGATIRVPINMHRRRFEVKSIRDQYKLSFNREPTVEELCEATGYTENCVNSLLNYVDDNSLISLEAVVPGGDKDKGTSTFGEIIPDCDFSIDKDIEDADVHNILNNMLNNLDDRSKLVLELRVGFNGNRVHTLEEVGDMLGVTRERVRQIEKKALRKMSIQSKRTKALEGYLEGYKK